ncbi:MAG: PH domain-containing protein [Candidatus Peregrinibacteria bacterium]|nr:PH domain-containing protein [Candidatus Peregrinibacteria bacterium]
MITDFPGRQPNEKILLVIRKHFIVYIRIVLLFLVTSVIPVLVFIAIWSSSFPLNAGGSASIIGYLGATIYFLYSLAVLLIAWLDEEFDLFILTDHRLIDITQVSFLKRTVATTPLDQIQDTTSNISGILATILNYGTIDVQTAAGMASSFTIDHVPDPAMTARQILNYVESSRGADYIDPPLGEGMPQSTDTDIAA